MPDILRYLEESGRLYDLAVRDRARGDEAMAAWLDRAVEQLPEEFKRAQERAAERKRVRQQARERGPIGL